MQIFVRRIDFLTLTPVFDECFFAVRPRPDVTSKKMLLKSSN